VVYFTAQTRKVDRMRDLDRALTDISVIREQLAQSTEFQGYAPATVAATGVFALLVAAVQGLWLPESATNMRLFIALWVGTAAVCVVITAIETIRRSRRAHTPTNRAGGPRRAPCRRRGRCRTRRHARSTSRPHRRRRRRSRPKS